ncbi:MULTISPECIES: hypothetical protein [Burkholderia]|uniref:hypothetical protein n=1 Tax=Burkholderia TaxID=32008 RepID=UPI00397C4A57
MTQIRKPLDMNRTHTVGRFLNENPEAKKFVVGERRNALRKFHSLGNEENKQHVTRRGGVATRFGSMIGKGAGFDISCKARAV